MNKHVPPKLAETKFHCPFCGVFASQQWSKVVAPTIPGPNLMSVGRPVPFVAVGLCTHCDQFSIWMDETMVYPDSGAASPPHEDMPDEVKADFHEARSIVSKSPRGAAALLRLAIQKLMPHLGERGKKIDDDIAGLVKKGLPIEIQQALDTVRVIGNESVHPGEINLNDTPETAHALFELVNIIVQVMIAQPKKIRALYSALPAGKLSGIQARDARP